MITIERVYNPVKPGKQYRVLVDRLWPRGISKERTLWNEWMKDISPSDELRKWFNHDPNKWEQFKQRYKEELTNKQKELKMLKDLEKEHGVLTLVYAAKDETHNNASILKEAIMLQTMD